MTRMPLNPAKINMGDNSGTIFSKFKTGLNIVEKLCFFINLKKFVKKKKYQHGNQKFPFVKKNVDIKFSGHNTFLNQECSISKYWKPI